jgi:quinoprotein glucose dehydrogenase
VTSERVPESRRDTFTIPNPVTVYKNLLISGARPGEQPPPQPRGDIRAWDAVSGKLVWSFHTVPQPGEPNFEDWPGDTWKDRSGCNVWSNLTADESTGLVFGATVDQRFRAFDAKTGKELWVAELPANGNATPITYSGKDGAQYVVIAAGGGGPAARGQRISDALVAFKLPR